jgi:hypothetical protein
MKLAHSVWVMASMALSLSLGCTSAQVSEPAPISGDTTESKAEPAQDYENRIERFSAGDTQYSGFYNNFEYRATLLNSSVRAALLERQSAYYQWDTEKQASEREKSTGRAAAETEAFLSFFTPDRHNDNLADNKSIWRVYLEAGGKRYIGKVRKLRSLLAELQALYPYHTRWNTPYMVTFPILTSAVETQTAKLTVTGPLGTRAVTFSPIGH